MDRSSLKQYQLKTPPTAPGWPLLGNAIDLVRNPLAFFLRMYLEMGPVFQVGGGSRRYTVLAGPEANRRFVEWEGSHLISGPVYQPYVDDLGSEKILVAMDGPTHKAFRKWLRPGFSREAISPRIPQMIEAAEAMIAGWHVGDTINVTDVMQQLIADMSGIGFTGCPAGDHFSDAQCFAHTFLGAGVGSFPGLMRRLPTYRGARHRFRRFLDGLIASHRQNALGERTPDLIDLLLRNSTPFGIPLTDADIQANAHMPYTNSLVYVGATCGFMLYELLKHPAILKEVQTEVDALFADGPPELKLLRRSKWLRAVLLETQRLHPISLSIPRYVVENFAHEGYLIEAGSMTLTATAVTHFLPEFFPEPYCFDPSRYWAPRREHRQQPMLLPFGLGPHICLSAGVVNTLILLCIGTLLHQAEFSLVPSDYELKISVAPFPAPARSFSVQLARKRQGTLQPMPAMDQSPNLEDSLPDIDPTSLARAVDKAKRRRFGPGNVIIREGDPAETFYVIVAGEVEVVRERVDAGSRLVARLGKGSYFGEIGLLHGVPRTASVRASGDVELLELDRDAFVELVAETDLISDEIAELLERRLVSTTLASSLPRLSLEQVARIAPQFTLKSFTPGQTVLRQGDPADEFYIIVRGQVEIINEHPAGHTIFLNTLTAGDYFGEIGLLQGQPRNATVKATEDSELIVMALCRDEFLTVMSESEPSNEAIALKMVARLGNLVDHTREE